MAQQQNEKIFSTKDNIIGGIDLLGGVAGAWSRYNTSKSNVRTAQVNAAELLSATQYNAGLMRREQQRNEAANMARIAKSGLTSASFTDVLRDDLMESEAAINKMQEDAVRQAGRMVRDAEKARRKAKSGLWTQGLIGLGSAVAAPFTGGASLAVGGAVSQASQAAGY